MKDFDNDAEIDRQQQLKDELSSWIYKPFPWLGESEYDKGYQAGIAFANQVHWAKNPKTI